MKPVSLLELSAQATSISSALMDEVATRLLGAAGAPEVVVWATLELADAPKAVLAARRLDRNIECW